jgi:DNA-binding MarR family transcriptional regulator
VKGEKKRTTQLEKELANCACTGLRMSARVMTRLYDEALAPSGVRITQLATLATVAFHGPFTVKALAKVLVMDRTTLTADLKPLEAQGFLEVTPGQDRRTRVIAITKSGRAALEKAVPLWRKAQVQVKEHLGERRLHALLGELREVIALPKSE